MVPLLAAATGGTASAGTGAGPPCAADANGANTGGTAALSRCRSLRVYPALRPVHAVVPGDKRALHGLVRRVGCTTCNATAMPPFHAPSTLPALLRGTFFRYVAGAGVYTFYDDPASTVTGDGSVAIAVAEGWAMSRYAI